MHYRERDIALLHRTNNLFHNQKLNILHVTLSKNTLQIKYPTIVGRVFIIDVYALKNYCIRLYILQCFILVR